MSHDTPKGARPDFVEYTYLSQSTLEKRVRRALAKQNQFLLKARPEQIPQIGLYAICGANRQITRHHLDLATLAHELGVLADHERLDHSGLGWVWAVARRREVIVDGKLAMYNDPLTREFASEAAARRAAEAIADKEGLAIVGWDVGRAQS